MHSGGGYSRPHRCVLTRSRGNEAFSEHSVDFGNRFLFWICRCLWLDTRVDRDFDVAIARDVRMVFLCAALFFRVRALVGTSLPGTFVDVQSWIHPCVDSDQLGIQFLSVWN